MMHALDEVARVGYQSPPRVAGPTLVHTKRSPAQQTPGAARHSPWETHGRQILPTKVNPGHPESTQVNTSQVRQQVTALNSAQSHETGNPADPPYSNTGIPLNRGNAPSVSPDGRAVGKGGIHRPSPTTCFSHTA